MILWAMEILVFNNMMKLFPFDYELANVVNTERKKAEWFLCPRNFSWWKSLIDEKGKIFNSKQNKIEFCFTYNTK